MEVARGPAWSALIAAICVLALTSCEAGPATVALPEMEWRVYNSANSALPHDWVHRLGIAPDGSVWAGLQVSGLAHLVEDHWLSYTAAESGLPDDRVLDLHVTPSGVVWVGTGTGLGRFDGSAWTVYTQANAPFVGDHVSAVHEDQDGVVWVGSGNVDEGGLYSLKDGQWTSHTVATSPLPCGIVETIMVDASNTKWVGTSQCRGVGGLLRISGGAWNVFNQDNSGLRYNAVESLAEDEGGGVWAGAAVPFYLEEGVLHGSLTHFDGVAWEDWAPAESGLMSNRVDAVEVDQQGRVWVATHPDGVFDYEVGVLQNGRWIPLSSVDPNFPHTFITDIGVDEQDRVWLASGVGVIVVELR
jgi:ligand-binding sensor domain-containing protein